MGRSLLLYYPIFSIIKVQNTEIQQPSNDINYFIIIIVIVVVLVVVGGGGGGQHCRCYIVLQRQLPR